MLPLRAVARWHPTQAKRILLRLSRPQAFEIYRSGEELGPGVRAATYPCLNPSK